MSKRFIATLTGALAIVVLAAGCGGGSDSGDGSAADAGGSDSGAPGLTKAEFIAQGDELCGASEEEIEDGIQTYMEENGVSESDGPSEEQEEGLVTEVILPRFQALAGELGELGAPKGEEAQVEAIVAGLEEVVADGESDPSGVIGADNPFEDVNRKATEFGFKVCGS